MRYIDPETWARTWSEAAPRLAEIRRRELETVHVAEVVRSLSDAFEASIRSIEPSSTSGLVEQQRLFARLRG
jgi:hypothetical protein